MAKRISLRKDVFHHYLVPFMEANGWTVEKKTRSNNPGHVDYYYFPPGVSRGLGFKARMDFWDSIPLLLSALKARVDDAVAQFVLNVYMEGEDVEKLMKKNKCKSMDEFVRHVNIQLPVGVKIPENVRCLWSRSFSALSSNIPSEHSVSQSSDTGGKPKSVSAPKLTKKKCFTSKNYEKTVAVDLPVLTDDISALETCLIEKISRSIGLVKPQSSVFSDITDSKFTNESTDAEIEARLVRNIRKNIEYESTTKKVDHHAIKSPAEKLRRVAAPDCSSSANDIHKLKSSIIVRARPLDHLLSMNCNSASKTIVSLAALDVPKSDFSADPKFDSSNVTIPRKRKENAIAFDTCNQENDSSDQRNEIPTYETLKIPRKKRPTPNLEASAIVSTEVHCDKFSLPIRLDNTELVPTPQLSDVKAEYFHFQSKILPVCKIEFKGIHGQVVYKFLWKRHKQLYGYSCNDNCRCLSNLKTLFEGVMEKSEQSSMSQGKEAPQVSRTGFVNSFAQRYYAELSRNFPMDNPTKILGKLLEMWKQHKKTRQFGECCGSMCSCDYSSLVKCVSVPLPSTQNAAAIVDPITAPALLPGSLAKRAEYCISFDSSAPLGFYSTTSTKDLSSFCKVASVNPYKADMDPRVSRGTIVRAVEVNGERKEIESHVDLKNHYFRARSIGGKLSLWFFNQSISPCNILSQKRNWNLSGAWSGINEDGWAGGADKTSKIHAIPYVGTSVNLEKPISGLPSVTSNNLLKWSNQPKSAQRAYPRVSALKRPRRDIACLKVRIGEKLNKTKYFEKESVNKLSKSSIDDLGKYTDLTRAVHRGTVRDVLNVLSRGVDVEDRDGNNMTALQYTYESCCDTDNSFLSLNTLQLKQINMLKQKILKFFIEGNLLIYACDALFHWSYADVSIRGFRGLSPLEFTNSNFSMSPTTMFYTVEVGNQCWSSPCISINQSVTWPEESVKALRCEFHHECYKENEIKVTLYAGDHFQKIPLGLWMEDIDETMKENDEEETNLVAKLKVNGNFFSQEVQQGMMTWQLKRQKFDPEEAEAKRLSLAKKLHMLVAWLKKLMQEVGVFKVKIDANVGFPFHGNRTLLHAAVYLQDQKLVKQLLDLGADPNIGGCVEGSPLELACKKSYSSEIKSDEIRRLLFSFQRS